MNSEGLIVNKVAESQIEVFDLSKINEGLDLVEFDIADYLFEGLILREKDFRERLKELDWTQYDGKLVALKCSADAIIPTWAYMLVASKLKGISRYLAYGEAESVWQQFFASELEKVNWERYADIPVVVKGCGSQTVSQNAYMLAVEKLQGHASKIMFGEPCSSVPVWRKAPSRPKPSSKAKPARLPKIG